MTRTTTAQQHFDQPPPLIYTTLLYSISIDFLKNAVVLLSEKSVLVSKVKKNTQNVKTALLFALDPPRTRHRISPYFFDVLLLLLSFHSSRTVGNQHHAGGWSGVLGQI